MKAFQTDQEKFWAGEFGDSYLGRNDGKSMPGRLNLFSKVISSTNNIKSAAEFGANIGLNLKTLRALVPACKLSAVEINDLAVKELSNIQNVKVHHGSILDVSPGEIGKHDLTFCCGVLIHINPEFLTKVYDQLYACSNKYILLSEYYNPTPVEVLYRGHKSKLFKRDFAGEMLNRFSDLELVTYGFTYHRDYNFPGDDTTWFLLKKS